MLSYDFLGSLNIVRIQIDIAVILDANKVESFLWFSSQNASKPFPSHHNIQNL